MTGTFHHPRGPAHSRGPSSPPTPAERAVVLGGFALAALCTAVSAAAGAGMEAAVAMWLAALAWAAISSLAFALRRGFRGRDWSAFRGRGLPRRRRFVRLDDQDRPLHLFAALGRPHPPRRPPPALNRSRRRAAPFVRRQFPRLRGARHRERRSRPCRTACRRASRRPRAGFPRRGARRACPSRPPPRRGLRPPRPGPRPAAPRARRPSRSSRPSSPSAPPPPPLRPRPAAARPPRRPGRARLPTSPRRPPRSRRRMPPAARRPRPRIPRRRRSMPKDRDLRRPGTFRRRRRRRIRGAARRPRRSAAKRCAWRRRRRRRARPNPAAPTARRRRAGPARARSPGRRF